jgi:hypothetical protein
MARHFLTETTERSSPQLQQAIWFSRRASELAPHEPEVVSVCTEVADRMKRPEPISK